MRPIGRKALRGNLQLGITPRQRPRSLTSAGRSQKGERWHRPRSPLISGNQTLVGRAVRAAAHRTLAAGGAGRAVGVVGVTVRRLGIGAARVA